MTERHFTDESAAEATGYTLDELNSMGVDELKEITLKLISTMPAGELVSKQAAHYGSLHDELHSRGQLLKMAEDMGSTIELPGTQEMLDGARARTLYAFVKIAKHSAELSIAAIARGEALLEEIRVARGDEFMKDATEDAVEGE